MTNKPVQILLLPKESLLLSISRDVITFGFLLFCMYISSTSIVWSILMAVVFMLSMTGMQIKHFGLTSFKSVDEAIDYLKLHLDRPPSAK